MLVISIGVLCVLISLGVASVIYSSRAAPKEARDVLKKKPGLAAGYWFYGLRLSVIRKLRLEEEDKAHYEGLYVNEQPEQKRILDGCKQGALVLIVLSSLSVLLVALAAKGAFDEVPVSAVIRPEDGTGVRNLTAIYEGERYDLMMTVPQRKLSLEEVEEVWNRAREHLPEWIRGHNVDLTTVTEPLTLIERLPGTTVPIQWLTSDYQIIDYDGTVHTENAASQGSEVTLTAEVAYGEWSDKQELHLRVLPTNGFGEGELKAQLQKLIEDVEASQEADDTIALPEQWKERPIQFFLKGEQSPGTFVLIAFLCIFGLLLAQESARKKERKERERQLLEDYPDVVSKLTLLLEAGMTPRHAWERIVTDYMKRKERDGVRRYVYEEMLRGRNQLLAGGIEEQVYESFGRSCGNLRYLRMSSVLVQNLKKGTASIIPLLQKEAAEAFCDRKERAKQAGEEAGTKLLLPMGGILVLILAIVMVPAFMAF